MGSCQGTQKFKFFQETETSQGFRLPIFQDAGYALEKPSTVVNAPYFIRRARSVLFPNAAYFSFKRATWLPPERCERLSITSLPKGSLKPREVSKNLKFCAPQPWVFSIF